MMKLECTEMNGHCEGSETIDTSTTECINANGTTEEYYGENLLILKTNDQIKELQTIIRDKCVFFRNNQMFKKFH